MIRTSITILLSLIFVATLQGQTTTSKYSNEFMNIGVDARAFGMGLSMVSHTSDVSSGYWNPAGLNYLKSDYQMELMHSSYYAGIASYDFAAFGARLEDSSVLAVSVIRFSVDDIADTRNLIDATGAINYDNIEYFAASDYAFLISYARKLPWLNGLDFGGSVKVIRRIVGDFGGSWGFGLDAGVQKKWGEWNFGLVGKDLFGTFNSWTLSEDELAEIYAETGNEFSSSTLEITLPRVILGASRCFQVSEKFSILGSIDLTTTTDGKRNTVIRTNLISVDPAMGMEVGFKKMAFLRLGMGQFQQTENYAGVTSWSFQPNVGIGIKIQEVTLDYAYTDIGDQAAGLYSHIFSLKVDFNVED